MASLSMNCHRERRSRTKKGSRDKMSQLPLGMRLYILGAWMRIAHLNAEKCGDLSHDNVRVRHGIFVA